MRPQAKLLPNATLSPAFSSELDTFRTSNVLFSQINPIFSLNEANSTMSSNNNSSETTPADNLYAYAASAVPPKMDREIHLARGETPRGDFWIDTKVARPLLQVHQINPVLISDRAQKCSSHSLFSRSRFSIVFFWVSDPIPIGQIIPEPSPSAVDNLVLPGKNHTRGNPKTLTRFGGAARTMDDVGHWIDRIVLCTAIAILNLSSPFGEWKTVLQQGRRTQATQDDPGSGEDTIECRVNIIGRQLTGRDVYQTHMVVFSFPPWKVTPNDFRDFSKVCDKIVERRVVSTLILTFFSPFASTRVQLDQRLTPLRPRG